MDGFPQQFAEGFAVGIGLGASGIPHPAARLGKEFLHPVFFVITVGGRCPGGIVHLIQLFASQGDQGEDAGHVLQEDSGLPKGILFFNRSQ